ncbi:hypothetical protein A2924_00330 [Candidatus Giovannonibacteria bacterium RIFCSPLOWO2_01_FULL_44_16]|uniref:Lycopene cyclase domain-containing protein n=1 Tax=Candidatus Giovannonibacteria bacterium RIFCSPLOWO2_01_FULL_44_16 TaxID=1798348 RepID=A0A1F5X2B2_9BACT|nr:MAG: hypothetical protein A2924_00330 [Candidatus Giovannonibacteria bacterium RIFCSPLOWO2_01_FULL_44_16]
MTCSLALATLLVPAFLRIQYPALTILALAVIGVLMLAIKWNKRNALLYLAIFVSGPIAESISIYFGAWSYNDSTYFGIPFWLPFVWGNASLYIVRVKALIDSFTA